MDLLELRNAWQHPRTQGPGPGGCPTPAPCDQLTLRSPEMICSGRAFSSSLTFWSILESNSWNGANETPSLHRVPQHTLLVPSSSLESVLACSTPRYVQL